MAVKYRILYKDHHNQQCRVDISKASYAGEVIRLRGVEGKACIISYDCSDDPYDPIVNSKAAISFYQTEDEPVDVVELKLAQDREFIVEFYVTDVLKFKGFMITGAFQRSFLSPPYELSITATDGLMLLDNIDYTHANLLGGRIPINFFRQILFASVNLGLALPIQWVNSLQNTNFPGEDVMAGSVEWSPGGIGYTDFFGTFKSNFYILDGMLRAMQCRIMQSGGKWVIWRINDVVTGTVTIKELDADIEDLTITTTVVDITKTIGGDDTYDYRFIEEDAILSGIPALRKVVVTYEQDQRDNILPNGNMDVWETGKPLFWNLFNTSTASLAMGPSLSAATGNSVKITTNPGATNIFSINSGALPIDTATLYSFINFGFKFSIEDGAVVDGDGIIQWGTSAKFNIQILYYAGTITYYLNEFGFWTDDPTNIPIEVANLKEGDVAQIDFNAHQDIIMPLPDVSPLDDTNEPSIQVFFNLQADLKLFLDDIYITTDNNSDVNEAEYTSGTNMGKEEYTLPISSSANGFFVSNFMTNYSDAGIEKKYNDGVFIGTLTALTAVAVMRNRYKPSDWFEGSIYGPSWDYAQIYTIKNLPDKKFLPLKANWNTETNTIVSTLVEVRNDSISLIETHYGKNDKTLLTN